MLGVFVEGQQLRSAAQKMKQFATQTKNLPQQVVQSAQRADSANRGLMCADAAEDLADDFKTDMEKLSAHFSDTREVLDDIADDWEEADKFAESNFKPIGSELSGFTVPTISGGA